jgi:hypothetical protein
LDRVDQVRVQGRCGYQTIAWLACFSTRECGILRERFDRACDTQSDLGAKAQSSIGIAIASLSVAPVCDDEKGRAKATPRGRYRSEKRFSSVA